MDYIKDTIRKLLRFPSSVIRLLQYQPHKVKNVYIFPDLQEVVHDKIQLLEGKQRRLKLAIENRCYCKALFYFLDAWFSACTILVEVDEQLSSVPEHIAKAA